MLENTYRDENGLLRYKRALPMRLEPGTKMFWVKSSEGGYVNVAVTVIEHRADGWVIVQAADGKHRVRPRNLQRHPDQFAWSEECLAKTP